MKPIAKVWSWNRPNLYNGLYNRVSSRSNIKYPKFFNKSSKLNTNINKLHTIESKTTIIIKMF